MSLIERMQQCRSDVTKQWRRGAIQGVSDLIDGSVLPTFATDFDWYSQRVILRPRHFGSIVEIKRIEEPSHLPTV